MSLLDTIFSARFVQNGVEFIQRKTIEIAGDGATVQDDPANNRTIIIITGGGGSGGGPHAATHIWGGSDAIGADRLKLTFLPAHFTRLPGYDAVNVDELTAHLNGIDSKFGDVDYGLQYHTDAINTNTAAIAAVNRIVSVTEAGTSHAFALSDAYKTIYFTSNSAIAVQIPANATVPYETGTVIELIPMGTGQITVSGAGGVTVVSGGGELKSGRQYAPIQVRHTPTVNTWLVTGEKTT